MMSHRTLLLVLALAWLTSCLPEEQLARLLDRHPALLTQLAPSLVRDSTVTQQRDTVLSVQANGATRRVRVLLREVTHYRTTHATLVLDNARSRRLLADSQNHLKMQADQLKAAKLEVARLSSLTYPKWYRSTWFWISLLLLVLLICSIGLRFTKFSLPNL